MIVNPGIQNNIRKKNKKMCTIYARSGLSTAYCTIKYKKLSYCWETVRRESMPRIAEMDVEMTT